MRVAALLWPLLLALPLAAAAAADGPPRTVERLAEPLRREVVLLVSGYGSDVRDGTWSAVIARFASEPRYELRRFGATPGRAYDTTGSLDENARRLIAEVRELGRDGASVHLVAHSMGGVVADRAFALGLGAPDGVRTYVALAAPHAGSAVARVAQGTLAAAGEDRDIARALIADIAQDPDTTAARDLAAELRPPDVIPGVARVHVRSATDAIVLHGDARGAPGVDTRTLLPRGIGDLEGHGAILRDPRALELLAATVADRAPPRDERSAALRLASDATSRVWSDAVTLLLGVAAALVLVAARAVSPLRRRRGAVGVA